MNRVRCAFILLSAIAISGAQTTISGNIGDMTLDSAGNPFIVEKDITVPKGKSLTIREGCVLIFKQFTGLLIQGRCAVEGTETHPVVFTSINDAAYNKTASQDAATFDWNGITVDKKSGPVVLNHFVLRFSVYGIKSQNPGIVIRNGIFSQNGQFHFTVNDKIQSVQDNEPFTFNGSAPIEKEVSPSKSGSKILRYSLLGVGAAGAIAGIIMTAKAASAYSDWSDLEQQTNPLPEPGEYENRRDKYHSALTGALIFDILGGLGLAGFGVTFVF